MLKAACSKNLTYSIPSQILCSKIRASILLLGPLLSRFGKVKLPLPGGDVIGARRIDTHFEAIKALGGNITLHNQIEASITHIHGAQIFLDEPSVTATENTILLAVLAQGTTNIYNAACEPHISGLCNLLCKMGAKIEGIGSNSLKITGVSSLGGTKHSISPDFMEIGKLTLLRAIACEELTIKKMSTLMI